MTITCQTTSYKQTSKQGTGDIWYLQVAEQLELLSKAKTWYIDGTFKLIRQPFTQLLTVNAFVRSGDAAKQVPFVYVLMSSCRKKDYKVSFSIDLVMVFDAILTKNY